MDQNSKDVNQNPKLFVVLLGGRPNKATIEQHNVFFGIAYKLEDLYGAIKRFWPIVRKIHIDAYMVIDKVGDYDVLIDDKDLIGSDESSKSEQKLFFVNLGGYQEDTFGESHKRLIVVAPDRESAVALAKQDDFYVGNYGTISTPHIDDSHLLDEVDVEVPINIQSYVEDDTYCITLKKVRLGCKYKPEVVIGYRKID